MSKEIITFFANAKIEQCDEMLNQINEIINRRKHSIEITNRKKIKYDIINKCVNCKWIMNIPHTKKFTCLHTNWGFDIIPNDIACINFAIANGDIFKHVKYNRHYKYIYIINYENMYKIGIANDVYDRQKRIETISGHQNILIYAKQINHARKIERLLHRYFANKKTLGEWFILDENDINYVISFIDNISQFTDAKSDI